MSIVFFNGNGMVHKECLLSGQTVTSVLYVIVRETLRKQYVRVHRVITDVSWKFHRDNRPRSVPAFVVMVAFQPFFSHPTVQIRFPRHFPRLKLVKKVRHHKSVQTIQEAVTAFVTRKKNSFWCLRLREPSVVGQSI